MTQFFLLESVDVEDLSEFVQNIRVPAVSPSGSGQELRGLVLLEKANSNWRAEGLPELPTRFGLASGQVTVGNVGAVHRLSYTVLGDPVNLAQRLEAPSAQLNTPVLADENVRNAASDVFEWRTVHGVTIKGKIVSVRVFELLGRCGGASLT
jgi:class 3 adenylate cyclase